MKDKSTLKIHGGEGGKCKQPINKLPKQSIKQKNKKGTDKRKMTWPTGSHHNENPEIKKGKGDNMTFDLKTKDMTPLLKKIWAITFILVSLINENRKLLATSSKFMLGCNLCGKHVYE